MEAARNSLGYSAAPFSALTKKMVTNEVLVHPSRKGLSPGPGLRSFLTFARLFNITPDEE